MMRASASTSTTNTSTTSWFQILILLAALTTFAPTSRTKGRLWLAALNAPQQVDAEDEVSEMALFGMGCFWEPQSVFQKLPGVLRATAGYASLQQQHQHQHQQKAGTSQRQRPASYLSTCAGDGRTEAILVEYLPSIISYSDLLHIFWQYQADLLLTTSPELLKLKAHQRRAQYQSAVWPLTDDQRRLAQASWEQRNSSNDKSLSDQITLATTPPIFFVAESVHQNFWSKVRLKLTCLLVGTVVSTTLVNTIAWMDGFHMTDATVKLVLMWGLWEGLELVVKGLGSLSGWSLWTAEQIVLE
jgi:peptide-methionine (S)-S-oxide reductase